MLAAVLVFAFVNPDFYLPDDQFDARNIPHLAAEHRTEGYVVSVHLIRSVRLQPPHFLFDAPRDLFRSARILDGIEETLLRDRWRMRARMLLDACQLKARHPFPPATFGRADR